ncbi:MAG: mRNA 3'-end-processing protein rna14 [Alectoria fallacina]|uniref:mRNA 3'-end-processing protein RNA14 n=1 Tax=Alectoria fallacina TaxID=1903189 RepID=A0A8H3PK78_9LECA|nr:MAG: mRNA 3'-end-processing protein rna14 [Alectoria fallacina]
MADEEAAFLSSMLAANDSAGVYQMGGDASGQRAESISSDEYDPSQTVQTEPLPASTVQSTSNNPPLHEKLPTASDAPLISTSTSAAPALREASASLSRSMSRASSETSDSIAITTNQQEHSQIPPNNSSQRGEEALLRKDAAMGQRGSSSLLPVSDSSVNISTNHVSADNVPIKNGVHEQKHSESVQYGVTDTVPNLAAVIPDTGASSHSDSTAKPSETLPAPSMADTRPLTREEAATPITAAPKARLPHDKIGILEDRIKEDPRGDLDAWQSLINEHKRRGKLEDARNVYERFLTIFPSAAEEWVAYAQMENEVNNRTAVEKIFNRALRELPYLGLWSMYLDHIRRHNNIAMDPSGLARQIINSAYDIALQHIGLDKESGKIWQDYVQFLKSGPGIVGGSTWQDQQKMDSLRSVYQRAICIPTQFTNLLWKEYDGFEMSLNKITGRKFVQDQSPAYMTARSSHTELQNITRNLRRTTLPVLPPALGFDGDVEYLEQLDIWKRWIQWEKNDPLVLKVEEVVSYRARIVFVYKQALMAMRFWPELWAEASDFCFANDLESEGDAFLAQGIAANPESCLLAFKRADRTELNSTKEEGDDAAIRRGTAVREPYDKVLDALYDIFSKSKIREDQDVARIEANFAASDDFQKNGVKADEENDEDEEEEGRSKEKEKAAQIESVKNMHGVQQKLLSKTLSHVWIALTRAMRRIQGKGKVNHALAGSRGIFADARKRGRITSDVYVASALMEFHCYEVETGKKIFERGLRLFSEDEEFALQYIKHLVANNDHTNARVVFETAVTKLALKPETVSKAKPLYAFFHDFESRYGELTQIVKLEKRMIDLFPEDPALTLFSRRFAQQGFDPTAIRPIISPATQTRPKASASIKAEVEGVPDSPQQRINEIINSPKRPLPTDDDDDSPRPRKVARPESPLKGAAGRRLDQQKRNRQPEIPQFTQPVSHPPPPPPLPRDVMFLLSIIPKAETYHATKFSAEQLVKLLRETNIPTSMAQAPTLPGARGLPQNQPMPPYQPMPPPNPQPQVPYGHSQYNGQYNGGYPQFSIMYASSAPAHPSIGLSEGSFLQAPSPQKPHHGSHLAQNAYPPNWT